MSNFLSLNVDMALRARDERRRINERVAQDRIRQRQGSETVRPNTRPTQRPGSSDSYVRPGSSEATGGAQNWNRFAGGAERALPSMVGATPGVPYDLGLAAGGARDLGTMPSVGFQSSTPIGNNFSYGGGDRLDTPAKVEAYINSRKNDLPPTAASLEQLAKEVTERGGTVAIATHAGGKLQSDDAIVLENGATIDLIGSVGDPGAKWQWLHHGKDYGATYDPGRTVVDPKTGEMKSFAQFLTERGKPVPPYVPMIDDGSSASGGMDHLKGWIVDADKEKKKTYQPMDGFDTAALNNPKNKGAKVTFGRWIQDNKMPPTLDSLKAFVAANPDFELNGDQLRVKPSALAKYADDPSAGEWHQALTSTDGKPAFSFTPVDPTNGPTQLLVPTVPATTGGTVNV